MAHIFIKHLLQKKVVDIVEEIFAYYCNKMILRITTKDIAKKAGVDTSTVSRALRNHSEIALKTRRKIQAIAKEMGFYPDPMLAGLVAYRQTRKTARYQSTIAIISDSLEPSAWREGFKTETKEMFLGIEERSKELGYSIEEVSPRHMKVKNEDLSKILRNRGIRGVIVAPRTPHRGFLEMDWSFFSAITIGYSLIYPALNRVSRNQFSETILTMRRLRQLGYRRIGLAVPREVDERANHGYWAGFATENRCIEPKNQIPWFNFSVPREDNLDQFHSWLNRYKPDVVIGINNHLLNWLQLLKYDVPNEIGFASFCAVHPHLAQPLHKKNLLATGICPKNKIIGSTAMDLLVGMLHRNECGIPSDPKTILVDGCWVEGETVCSKLKKNN